MTQLSEEQQEPEPTIRTGGEDLSIFEIMQRYRNDGSCEYVIQDALRRLSLLDSDSKAAGAVTVKPDVLDNWLKPVCTRLMYGRCTTLYCLRRGGYTGEPADASIATCEAYEAYNALSHRLKKGNMSPEQAIATPSIR